MNDTARALIHFLALGPLKGEGGYFRRVGEFHKDGTLLGTTILYLMTARSFSSLHRLPTDESWTFLEGSPLEQLVLFPDGSHRMEVLGMAGEGQLPVSLVPGGCWQGTRLVSSEGYALCTTTMCPPYDEAGYEQGTADLIGRYPSCTVLPSFLPDGDSL